MFITAWVLYLNSCLPVSLLTCPTAITFFRNGLLSFLNQIEIMTCWFAQSSSVDCLLQLALSFCQSTSDSIDPAYPRTQVDDAQTLEILLLFENKRSRKRGEVQTDSICLRDFS